MGFLEEMGSRVLLFDGAMGTEIQKLSPKESDYPGGREGFADGLTLTHPEWISGIHRSYLEAGADCIETNSFGSNRIKLAEHGHGDRTVDVNRQIADVARRARDAHGAGYVIGSMGPTGYLPSSDDPDLGQLPLDDIREAFALQAEGLVAGGADALLIETSQDILEVKLAIEACREAAPDAPVIANATLDKYGKMLLGTPVQAAYTTVSGMGADVFGLNCSTGPAEMEPSVRWLAGQDCRVLVVPNAGMPENEGGTAVYKLGAEEMAEHLGRFVSSYGNVRVIGGCCGTGPGHIRAMRRVLDGVGGAA
ncbi:MAG: homocysteine S-methyltransferase family protein [Nitrosopumilus sp.]|nr:homocysteine S-methyltransferase family protein [Nitrosopumilus sp.]